MRLALCITLIGFTACSSNSLNNQNNDGSSMGGDMAVTNADLAGGGGMDLAMPSMCDPVAQNCPNPAAPKCELTVSGGGGGGGAMIVTMCVADGTAGEGQPCTIDMNTGGDDCQKGLRCTSRGSADGSTVCRKYCGADTDCSQGDKCSTLLGGGGGGGGGGGLVVGTCIPTCAMYGTTCGAGATCGSILTDIASTMTMRKSFLACRPSGSAALFAACTTSTDCGDNATCARIAGVRSCQPLCDDNNVCPANPNVDAGGTLSCTPQGGLPNNGGICE